LCREHALTLSALAADTNSLEGFGLFGVVKETGIDDEGLMEFSQKYFLDAPLFCDKSFAFYQALGDRRATDLPALWSMMTGVFSWISRIQEKNISGNTKGEGLLKGGLILFDTKGKPRYSYQEETGEDLPVADIVAALEVLKIGVDADK